MQNVIWVSESGACMFVIVVLLSSSTLSTSQLGILGQSDV
jgi:hypothetical protein